MLKDEIPQESRLTILIQTITAMSFAWKQRLETVEDNDLLTRWDNLTRKFDPTSPIDDTIAHLLFLAVKQNRNLSLRRFLQKMFTLHNHVRTILRIAWSRRLSPFLEGEFNIVLVPAAHGDILVKFSQQKLIHIAFPLEDKTPQNIKQTVYNVLLSGVQATADKQGIKMKKEEELSLMHINVHAECSLLAYHIQHPEIIPYRYFGGSKLSCHGCSVFFSSFNGLATSPDDRQFFTKGCHEKIYLRWPCPSLLSQQQQKQLRPNASSLDNQVKQAMIKILGDELAAYIGELRDATEWSTPPQSDSTAASGDSRAPKLLGIEVLRKLSADGMCESKLMCLLYTDYQNSLCSTS